MILQIAANDPTPVYEQIRSQLLWMISAGTLAPGTRLPTIRQLASDLGLAKGTVSKAYEALFRDGAIESRGRNGTVVALRPRTFDAEQRHALLVEATEQLAVTVRQLGASPAEAIRSFQDAWETMREGAV
jgi:DNA-binding transcriptional regulator YhcF (GntR family)